MRKRTRRRLIVPLPPRGLRPRLTRDQQLDLGLVHNLNLAAIADGTADETLLWHYVGGVLTWSKVADLLQVGCSEMAEQVRVATRLVERYGRTGRVLFDGPDLERARDGVAIMDQLAEIVDRPTAVAAAEWSERTVQAMEQYERQA